MIIYTGILIGFSVVATITNILRARNGSESFSFMIGFALFLPLFGRVLGWW